MAGFSFPVVGTSLHQQADTFGAGRSGGRSHKGIDIFADKGAAVVAVVGGTVVKAGDSGGLGGIRAWIRDDNGFFHYYAHLDSLDVKQGQRIETGQRLGGLGNTGLEARNTPPHLHYSVNRQGHTSESGGINPYEYLRTNGASVATTHAYDEGARTQPGTPVGMTPATGEPGRETIVDPDQQFVDSRRNSSDTMASIMDFISKAAAKTGGRELNTKALFGDMFADQDDVGDGHDHGSEVA